MRVGGNSLKYLQRVWNRKEGRGNKDFKKVGGGGGARGVKEELGASKRGGARTPLRTMVTSRIIYFSWKVWKRCLCVNV